MKVLLDMNNEKFLKLFALHELPGKLLGTELDMTFNSVFSSDDIWDRIHDASLLNDKACAKIEEYGKASFLGEVVNHLNKNFDANDGITWSTIDSAVLKVFDVFRDKLNEIEQKPINLPIDGLHKALERFDSVMVDSKTATGICGSWEVSRYGTEPGVPVFKIYYDGLPVVSSKIGSEFHSAGSKYIDLSREANLSDRTLSQICDVVKSVYMFARMSPDEQKKIQENSQSQGR